MTPLAAKRLIARGSLHDTMELAKMKADAGL